MSTIQALKKARFSYKDPDMLSEFSYCLLPEHYFDSPRQIDVTFERVRPHEQIDALILAEADSKLRHTLGKELRSHGYRVIECANGIEVLQQIGSELLKRHTLGTNILLSDLSRADKSDTSISMQITASNIMRSVVAFTTTAQAKLKAQLESVSANCYSAPMSMALILAYLEAFL